MKTKTYFLTLIVASVAALCVSCGLGGLGIFEGSSDVGGPKLAGSAAFDRPTGTYTLTGAGLNMWLDRDEFHMAWRKVTGDFSLAARIAFEGAGVNAHRKVGIMIRESLDADARYADVTVHGDGLTSLQYRPETGAETLETVGPAGADHIVLERRGGRIAMKTGAGAFSGAVTGEIALTLPETCYVGFFVCSHDADVVETGYFSDVEFTEL